MRQTTVPVQAKTFAGTFRSRRATDFASNTMTSGFNKPGDSPRARGPTDLTPGQKSSPKKATWSALDYNQAQKSARQRQELLQMTLPSNQMVETTNPLKATSLLPLPQTSSFPARPQDDLPNLSMAPNDSQYSSKHPLVPITTTNWLN